MNCFKQMAQVVDLDQYRPQAEKIELKQPTALNQNQKPQQAVVNPELWKKAIANNNIQKIYHNCSLDNCPELPMAIIDLGKKWVKASKRPSLYLHGNTGSGKTYFATCLYRALIERNHPWIIFAKSDDLDGELLDAIENKHEKRVLQKYFEVPFLFIDDLGVERPTDRMIRQYYSIIDRRVGDGLITVITSNVTIDKLPLGDRTISRLEHFYDIGFPKKDIRKNINLPIL